MKKLACFALLATMLAAFVLAPVYASDDMKSKLLDPDITVRTNEEARVSLAFEDTVKDLIDILETPDLPPYYCGSLELAIKLLGQFRAEEAIGALSRRLMFLPTTSRGGYNASLRPTESYYEAACALVKIGIKSVGPMLYKINMSRDPEERRIAAWVVMEIEGKEKTLEILDELMARVSPYNSDKDLQKQRIKEAKEYVKNYKPDNTHPIRLKMEKEKAEKAGKTAGADESTKKQVHTEK